MYQFHQQDRGATYKTTYYGHFINRYIFSHESVLIWSSCVVRCNFRVEQNSVHLYFHLFCRTSCFIHVNILVFNMISMSDDVRVV